VSAILLDAGPLVAVDRNDREVIAQLRVAQQDGIELRTTGVVITQVWCDPTGRQANLARLLRAVDIQPVDAHLGRQAGVLLGRAGAGDAVDATVAAIAATGDRILTSDPDDLTRLVAASRRAVLVVSC